MSNVIKFEGRQKKLVSEISGYLEDWIFQDKCILERIDNILQEIENKDDLGFFYEYGNTVIWVGLVDRDSFRNSLLESFLRTNNT